MAESVDSDVDEVFAQSVFAVEKELGVLITEDYLLLKFFNQVEYLKKMQDEEKKEFEKMNKKGNRTLG